MRKFSRLAVVVVVIAVAIYWFGIRPGQREAQFQDTDPTGYEACRMFDRGLRSGGDVSSNLLELSAATGLDASTSAIRDAIDDRNGGEDGVPFYTSGFDEMRDACSAAGFRF